MIRKIRNGSQLIAIIITRYFSQEGIQFVTPEQFSQQLAYMKHPTGKVIEAHRHNLVEREVYYTQEVLFIRKGKLRVDFYDDTEKYLESCILESGDTILLASGGHGFEVLEEVEMIEVKQGPYVDSKDKTRFEGISSQEVVIRDVNGL